jgi:hypothetical protein
MSKINSALDCKYIKNQILLSINHARWCRFLERKIVIKAIVLIVVPGLEHLCIPSVRLISPLFTVILVDNGLSTNASLWLSSALPQLPIFRLLTSFKGFGRYTLSHGNALNFLTQVPVNLIFLDPDCYIFEPALIANLFHSLKTNAIVSLYSDPSRILGFSIPDTFCFGVQAKSISSLRRIFDVKIGVVSSLSSQLYESAVQVWGDPVPFPHRGKTYFDTIHALAISAHLAGMGIDIIPTSEGQVFHVLGTSYRNHELQDSSSDINVTALNAHYFHCLIAEHLLTSPPNINIRKLIRYYNGSIGLLRMFPSFAQSQLRIITDEPTAALLQRKSCFLDPETFAPQKDQD